MKSAASKLLLSVPLRSSLGVITLAGAQRKRGFSGWKTPRVFGSYAVVLVTSGAGVYEDVRGVRRDVKAGDLIWIFPELGHNYGPEEQGAWEEFYVVFSGPAFDCLRSAGVLDATRPVWRATPVARWLRMLRATIRPARTAGDALRRVAALHQAIIELAARQPQEVETDGRDVWLTEACRRIEATPGGAPDWPKIAVESGMSYETFRKRFTARAGVSPGRYRLDAMIDRACGLLLKPGVTLREIAASLGFADEFHFSKAFKRRIGIAPAVFRDMARRGGE